MISVAGGKGGTGKTTLKRLNDLNASNLHIILKPKIDKTLIVLLTSKDKANFGEEVVVTGTRTPIRIIDSPMRTEVITKKEIENTNSPTLYDLINNTMVGVQAIASCENCNFSEIRMLGLESGYSEILIDGQPIFSGLAMVYGLQQISTEDIEKIEIIKGASSALYGSNAIGGVINIITKQPTLNSKLSFKFNGLIGNYKTKQASISTSKRFENFGGILSVILQMKIKMVILKK